MNMTEIEKEIERLENEETTWKNCERLSVLYIIRNENQQPRTEHYNRSYSYSDSEFINAFRSADIDRALDVLDKHMDIIKALYPKEYNAIIEMLKI